MAMERQDYPAMLPQLQPPQAVDILNDRVRQVGKVNQAIANWLQERRQLEEQYSAGLRRLAQRQIDGGDLGVFSGPWSSLLGSADTLADSHSTLATKIEVDVERPLREFASSNREMTQMSTIQGNLRELAKDVEKAAQKTDKLRGKGDKAEVGKVASASSDLDTAQSQWESQAPYVFENLQALDETRLNHLRDALTQFQTHEVDTVERDRSTAEQCLNVILNVETADEIKTFALKAVQNKPTLGRAQRNSVATPSRALPSSSSSVGPASLTPTAPQTEDDYTSQRSGSLPEDKQKGRLKGLRRFGTVMSRRQSKTPSTLPTTSESPERKQRPSAFSSLSGRFGRSRDDAPTLDSLQETSPRQRPSLPAQLGSEIFQSPSESAGQTFTTPAYQTRDVPPQVNGTSLAALNGSHQGDLADLDPPKPEQSGSQPQPPEAERDTEGYSLPPQNLDPISQAQQEAAAAGDNGASPFNVNIRDAPIQEDGSNSEAALASVATKLQAPPPISRRGGTVRGRRPDRNSTISSSQVQPEQPITEAPREASPFAAKELPEPAPIQTTAPAVQTPEIEPSAPAPEPGLAQSPSGVFAPGQVAASTFSPFSSQAEQPAPSPLQSDSRATSGLDQSRPDNQSIRSATTTGSQGGVKHPDLQETGLNSSVIETVSARFENGKLVNSSLIGEIALAYNPANFSSPFSNENIRLESFASLEKVAPNPAFINQIPDREGEYSINLSSLGKTQIAFKYQSRLSKGSSQAPLLLTPAFRPEANQFSVIINYALNPDFALNGRESATLSNVMLAITVDGAKATSCLSKPQGTFSREKNLMFWQLNDVTLTAGAAPGRLLARFATEGEAKGGNVEARWEITGTNAQGLGSGLSVSIQGQSSGAGDGSDPFADEGGQSANWRSAPGVKRLTSGTYTAK